MPIFAETSASVASQPAPEGNHPARAVQMIDLGTQRNHFDESKPAQRKVRITFELPDELREDGKPFLVSQKFTLTMHEKGSLRKFLQAWRGKPFSEEEAKRFDISVLLGKACLLNIVHEAKNEKTYANIASVSPLLKNMIVTAQITPSLELSLSAEDYHSDLFETLPDFLKDEIRESPEWQRLQVPAEAAVVPINPSAQTNEDDPLPF